ncbi:MAG: amino acid adenylation domain-containing protein [Rubrivivax sp.]
MSATLQHNFAASARRRPAATAVVEPGLGAIRYDALDALSDRMRDWLVAAGVGRGDRVGLFMHKSVDTLAALLGALKAGAAYVPVDSGAPAARGAYILHNCEVKALVAEAELLPRLQAELSALGAAPQVLAVTPGAAPGAGLAAALDAAGPLPPSQTVASDADDLAYILYTSGSTGRPKGVMLTQRNALSFVDWCSEVFEPRDDDRFSSHAPFHFDLSILDLHVCFKHAATLVLVGEDIGKDAPRLAKLIADERISIWYSAPSILALLAQFGDLARHDYPALRQVLFAGEVFAVKHLRALGRQLPAPRYFNLYGPTETNVCTWYEVPMPVPEERTKPYPIGHVCSHLQARVLDEDGAEVVRGGEGELCIAGPGVMQGYWSLPEQTARGFWIDAAGQRWYRTGDIVTEADDGCYTYLGRRDRMVKRRGYRVELGEIEAALYKHPRVKEAAVVALPDADAGVVIVAHLAVHDGKPPGLIEMKRHCSENMPLYMIPDRFVWQPGLPKTSTDKIDYQGLKALG